MKTIIILLVAFAGLSGILFSQDKQLNIESDIKIDSISISNDMRQIGAKKKIPELTSITGYKVEIVSACLYASAPYPIPARNNVNSQVYWNPEYRIEDAVINAYNIFGIKSNTEKLTVIRNGTYSGILSWECSNIPNGVYLIRISLANSNFNVPVIIAK